MAAAAPAAPAAPAFVPPSPPVFNQLIAWRAYYYPDVLFHTPQAPLFQYIRPEHGAIRDWWNAFHTKLEMLLRRERDHINNELQRPFGMIIDAPSRLEMRHFRTSGAIQRMDQPRMINSMFQAHRQRLNRMCRLSRRMNRVLAVTRREVERVLSELRPMMDTVLVTGEERPSPDYRGWCVPRVRAFMPSCKRGLQCRICGQYEGAA